MENEILKLATGLEQKRENAMMQGDGAFLESIYSDSLTYGHSSGYVESKEAYLKNFNAKNYDYQLVKTTIKHVTAIGEDALVIDGEMVNNAKLFGKDTKMNSVYLAVWRRENGEWRFLANQATLITH